MCAYKNQTCLPKSVASPVGEQRKGVATGHYQPAMVRVVSRVVGGVRVLTNKATRMRKSCCNCRGLQRCCNTIHQCLIRRLFVWFVLWVPAFLPLTPPPPPVCPLPSETNVKGICASLPHTLYHFCKYRRIYFKQLLLLPLLSTIILSP